MWHKIYLLPYIQKNPNLKQGNNTYLNGQNVFVLVYDFAYGDSDFYPVPKPDSMPGQQQPKAISQHEIKSVLPTGNCYQLLSFHQTFAGSLVFKGAQHLTCSGSWHSAWQAWVCGRQVEQPTSCCHKLPSLCIPCQSASGIGVVGAIQKAPFSHSIVRETCFKQTELSFSFGNDAFTEDPGIAHFISGKNTTGRKMMVCSQVLWALSLRLE